MSPLVSWKCVKRKVVLSTGLAVLFHAVLLWKTLYKAMGKSEVQSWHGSHMLGGASPNAGVPRTRMCIPRHRGRSEV